MLLKEYSEITRKYKNYKKTMAKEKKNTAQPPTLKVTKSQIRQYGIKQSRVQTELKIEPADKKTEKRKQKGHV